jgi:hypothetical protein
MSRMNRKTATLAVTALLCAAIAFAHDEKESRFEQKFAKDVPYRGGKVSIDHKFGSVTIRQGDSNEVGVRASIRSSDPEFGNQIRIETSSSGEGVKIVTVYPTGRWSRNRDFSYSVDYEIRVPRNAPVHVTNRFGSISASEIAPSSRIENGHGSIRLSNARGPQTVVNQFGSIDLREITGDVVAKNANGSIRAEEIRGKAELTNRFGSVVLINSREGAVVKNSNGSVDVRQVGGAAVIDNAFGTIKVQGVRGNLEVDGSHSRIDVRDVRGDADVSSAFGTIDVRDVTGSAKATNANGTVRLAGVRGNATVKTTFASAAVSNVLGAIDVQNQNGSISVSGAPACQPISLRTTFSSIHVALPASASYALNARTTFGRINSDLPITTTSFGGDSTVGTIGSGKCKMDLVNSNGSITIKKE